MVWHLVLMKPRNDLTPADRHELIAAFDRALREIPTVQDVHVGRRIAHGAAYETAAPDVADYMVSIAFDDLEGLQAYLRHPAHEALGAQFYQSVSAGLAYDFQVEGRVALARLLE